MKNDILKNTQTTYFYGFSRGYYYGAGRFAYNSIRNQFTNGCEANR